MEMEEEGRKIWGSGRTNMRERKTQPAKAQHKVSTAQENIHKDIPAHARRQNTTYTITALQQVMANERLW
jgi:hypothetical protein